MRAMSRIHAHTLAHTCMHACTIPAESRRASAQTDTRTRRGALVRRTESRFDLEREGRVVDMRGRLTLRAGARARLREMRLRERRAGAKTFERVQRGSFIFAHARLEGLEPLGQPRLKRTRGAQ